MRELFARLAGYIVAGKCRDQRVPNMARIYSRHPHNAYYHFTSNEKSRFGLDYLSRPLPDFVRTFTGRFRVVLGTCDWFFESERSGWEVKRGRTLNRNSNANSRAPGSRICHGR